MYIPYIIYYDTPTLTKYTHTHTHTHTHILLFSNLAGMKGNQHVCMLVEHIKKQTQLEGKERRKYNYLSSAFLEEN